MSTKSAWVRNHERMATLFSALPMDDDTRDLLDRVRGRTVRWTTPIVDHLMAGVISDQGLAILADIGLALVTYCQPSERAVAAFLAVKPKPIKVKPVAARAQGQNGANDARAAKTIRSAWGKAIAAGWDDVVAARPYRPNYEREFARDHTGYEMGRLYATEARASGCLIRPWGSTTFTAWSASFQDALRFASARSVNLDGIWPPAAAAAPCDDAGADVAFLPIRRAKHRRLSHRQIALTQIPTYAEAA